MAETTLQAAIAQLKALGDHLEQVSFEKTGIVPQIVKPVLEDLKGAVEDTPSYQDLMATIQNLKAEISEIKTRGQSFGQALGQIAVDFAAGGDPVEHVHHLEDGSIVKGMGVATHIASADGTVKRVIASFPTNPPQNR